MKYIILAAVITVLLPGAYAQSTVQRTAASLDVPAAPVSEPVLAPEPHKQVPHTAAQILPGGTAPLFGPTAEPGSTNARPVRQTAATLPERIATPLKSPNR